MIRRYDKSLVGKRVRLISCSDPYTLIRSGAEGTVRFIDDLGTVHVQWDDGSNLGLIEDEGDSFMVLESE